MGGLLRVGIWLSFNGLQEPPADGYWVADWAGMGPFMYRHQYVKATQYACGTNYDSSLVKHWQYDWRPWK